MTASASPKKDLGVLARLSERFNIPKHALDVDEAEYRKTLMRSIRNLRERFITMAANNDHSSYEVLEAVTDYWCLEDSLCQRADVSSGMGYLLGVIQILERQSGPEEQRVEPAGVEDACHYLLMDMCAALAENMAPDNLTWQRTEQALGGCPAEEWPEHLRFDN